MKRREFITFLGGAAASWPLVARAQQSRIRKVGFLFPGPSKVATSRIEALLEGIGAAGYHIQKEIEFIPRFADGDPARLVPLAFELIELNVDVVAAAGSGAANAVRTATSTTPIVALDLETDPVATGMIVSLARPGGNVTGFFFDFPQFRTKLLELVSEAVPNISKIAIIWDPNSGPAQLESLEAAAKSMKLKLQMLEARNADELIQAFDAAKRADAEAVTIMSSPFLGASAKLAADLALKYRLPAVTLYSEFARNGGLLTYGPNILDIYRHVGAIVAKVLQGSKPADLPVELPTKFELVVNLKSAKALGVTIPATILLRADEVIE
jgi:putative ABC transport system substrate-binding protein